MDETMTAGPELIKVPHHDLSYNEGDRRDVNSFSIEEIRQVSKQDAVHYARASGLKETGMSVNEVALMYDLLEKKGPCSIVELGRNYGCSTRLFLQHVNRRGGHLQSWDLKHWGNLKETFANQGFDVLEYADESYTINFAGTCFADIRIADSIMSPITPQRRWVDFLLIDTEHGLENALGEYMRWRQYLNAGSFIAFHDLCVPGVARAIEIVKEVESAFEGRLIREWQNERVDGYGISVLEWKG